MGREFSGQNLQFTLSSICLEESLCVCSELQAVLVVHAIAVWVSATFIPLKPYLPAYIPSDTTKGS